MLFTFPKEFFIVEISQGYFPNDNFSNVQFPKMQPTESVRPTSQS